MFEFLGRLCVLLVVIFRRLLRIKPPEEVLSEKISELEVYYRGLEHRISLAIIRKDTLLLAALRTELNDVANRLLLLRQKQADKRQSDGPDTGKDGVQNPV